MTDHWRGAAEQMGRVAAEYLRRPETEEEIVDAAARAEVSDV